MLVSFRPLNTLALSCSAGGRHPEVRKCRRRRLRLPRQRLTTPPQRIGRAEHYRESPLLPFCPERMSPGQCPGAPAPLPSAAAMTVGSAAHRRPAAAASTRGGRRRRSHAAGALHVSSRTGACGEGCGLGFQPPACRPPMGAPRRGCPETSAVAGASASARDRSGSRKQRDTVTAEAVNTDMEIFEDLELLNTTASGSLTEATSGERMLGREVMHLEKENWLLAGQVRAAEGLVVEEEGTAYFEYLQRIALSAQDGDVQGVEIAAAEMEDKGLRLGPRGYHGLVFAFVQAGDMAGALAAWRKAYISGLDPLPETFVVLVKGLFRAKRPPAQAVTLVAAMKRWYGDQAQVAWREMVAGLFETGYGRDGEAEFVRGVKRKWKANHQMYSCLIRDLCQREDGDERNVDKAHEWLRHMNNAGLMAAGEHIEPIIEGYIRFARPESAMELFRSMGTKGFMSPTPRISDTILLGAGDYLLENETLAETFTMMKRHDALPSTEIYTSMLFAVLASQKGVSDYVKFLHIYKEILVPGGPVNDMMLAMLFESLAISEDPEPMILVLESLHEKGRVLPRQSKESDPSGLTFVSRWISNNFMTAYEGEAERRKSSDVWEEPTIRQVDGELIGVGNCVVDEEGNVIAPSKLTVGQLRAELRARGLSDEGLRKDLYKRVQAARRSAPQEMAELAKRRSDKKKEEKRVELDTRRAKSATTYLDMPIRWQHFKFDKFGEPYCFFVEDKSIRDLEKEYHLTAQTRAMWGIPRPGVSLGGVVDDDWGEMPDPYVPEHMSAQQVSELMWKHAKADGLTPAYYRSMLDEESDLPLPEEVEMMTKMEVLEDGEVGYIDLEPEELGEEEEGQEGEGVDVVTEEMRLCIRKAQDIMLVAEVHGHVPTAQDLRLLVTVARCGLQTDDVPLLAGILEDHKSIVDPAGLSQMFRDLVSTCIEGGEVRIAYETFSRMLAAGVARDDAVDKLELQIQRAEDLQASQ